VDYNLIEVAYRGLLQSMKELAERAVRQAATKWMM
jgi:hypothetical protein